MPSPSQLAHRVTRSTALAYVTNVSPTSTDPIFVAGSADFLTSIAGFCERRPGFSDAVEATPTVFNNLQRLFTWNRFDGTTFIEMACDVNASNVAVVYKRVVGQDASFVSIFTDTTSTPFDFVVSNNQVYFSNGNVAKKWDPTNGISNWGIAVGSVNSATGPNIAGAGADNGGAIVWTNPGNVTSASNYATNTIASTVSDGLNASQFGFGLVSTTTVQGIQVTFDALLASGSPSAVIGIAMTKGGVYYGERKLVTINNTANANYTFGSASDLWGGTWTYNDVNQANFGCNLFVTVSGGTNTASIRNVNITVFGQGGPGISVSGSAGTMSAVTGYQYVFAYGNSNTGHISSPSPASASTGAFTNKLNVSAALTASTDGQVNQIHAYRSTDAISAGQTAPAFFEIPTSPYPNIGWTFTSVANASAGSTTYTGTPNGASGFKASIGQSFTVAGFTNGANNGTFPCTAATATTITLTNAGGVAETHAATGTLVALDAAADTALSVNSIAPIFGFNDPPTAFKMPVYAMGRIWGFANNKVYFSSLEESIAGVPEESFVSGVAANFWAFDQAVTGLAVAGSDLNQTVLVFCGGKVYGIRGNTLDTQRRFQIANRKGCRNQNCITSLGGMVAWLDSSSQIWATNGSTLQELSQDIRPDLAGLSPSGCSMTFHAAGKFHWLVFSNSGNTLVYDMDTNQWMPPWSVIGKYVYSGETSAGVYDLMISTGTKALKLNTSVHNDNGSTYTPIARISNTSTVPDFGSRFSYASQGIYDMPSKTGVPWYFQVDTNTAGLADVLYLANDDPQDQSVTYTSLLTQQTDTKTAWNRDVGSKILQNVFSMNGPPSRWISFQMKGANADDALRIYDWFLGYEEKR